VLHFLFEYAYNEWLTSMPLACTVVLQQDIPEVADNTGPCNAGQRSPPFLIVQIVHVRHALLDKVAQSTGFDRLVNRQAWAQTEQIPTAR